MIRNTVIKKSTGKKYKPQVKRIRQQPRQQIRQLLRSFEPLGATQKSRNPKDEIR